MLVVICIVFIIVNAYLLYTANAPFTKEEGKYLSTSTNVNSLRGGLYKRYVNSSDATTDFYLTFAAIAYVCLCLYF